MSRSMLRTCAAGGAGRGTCSPRATLLQRIDRDCCWGRGGGGGLRNLDRVLNLIQLGVHSLYHCLRSLGLAFNCRDTACEAIAQTA